MEEEIKELENKEKSDLIELFRTGYKFSFCKYWWRRII